MIKPTISLRLTFWNFLMLLIGICLFALLSFLFVSRQLYSEQFYHLIEEAEEISEFIRFNHQQLDLNYLIEETDELNLYKNGIFFEIWDDSYINIYRSRNFPRFLNTSYFFPIADKKQKIKDSTGLAYHIYTFAYRFSESTGDKKRDFRIRTGQSTIYVDKVLDRIRRLFLLLTPVVIIISSFGGWYLARRALKPVDYITQTARSISMNDLNKRLTLPAQDDELGRLIQTFNEMIERIQKGVQKVRQFTADASHELRTPLTIMRGEIEVALRRSRTVSEYKKILRSALQELTWMEKIVNDLLLLSRADSGEIILQYEKINLTEFLQSIIEYYKKLLTQKKIALKVEFANKDIQCKVDPDRFRQVIINLMDNAIKYTPKGGKISLNLKMDKNNVVILISDTGIGIPEKDLPFVFDRFYRVDKARSREQHSSGLGLAICKWIIEAHGGKIEIESVVNKGTTIKVMLPIN